MKNSFLFLATIFSFITGTSTLRAQSNVTTTGGTSGYLPRFNGSTTVVNSEISQDGSNNIGISDSTPLKKLDVNGDFNCIGIETFYYSTYTPSVVLGSGVNSVCTQSSTCYGNAIGGGGNGTNSSYANRIGDSNNFATICGGYNNVIPAGSDYSSIGGGTSNSTWESTQSITIGGGTNNLGVGTASTVCGGGYNTAQGSYAAVCGGYSNSTLYDYSTVCGGYDNYASGVGSTIPGGESNVASGTDSFAAGQQATADMDGAFVWSDSDSACDSTATDQFMVCADGGAYFSHNVSALSFTDRTPYPQDTEIAYEAVLSMQRLPDGLYDPTDESKQLDHSSLTTFVYAEQPDGGSGRNLSATVSAQNEVIKDLVYRIKILEDRICQ